MISHTEYLIDRINYLSALYRSDFPKWNNSDLVAVSKLLREVAQLRAELERVRNRYDAGLPDTEEVEE